MDGANTDPRQIYNEGERWSANDTMDKKRKIQDCERKKAPRQRLRRKWTIRCKMGRNTNIQDTLTTDTNERSKTTFTTKANDACLRWMRPIRWKMDKKQKDPKQILRRKRTTRVYDGCERHDERWTRRSNDPRHVNDGPVQHKFYDDFTTDSNDTMKDETKTRERPQILRGNDGCERYDERWTRSTKIQDTFTTDINERSNTNFMTKANDTSVYDGCETIRWIRNRKSRDTFTMDANDTMDWKQKVLPRKEDTLTTNTNDAIG